MTAPFFVDTNVLVYSLDRREPEKQVRAREWLDRLWATRSGRVSFQVLQEFYAIVTRKLEPGLDPETARKVVRSLWACRGATFPVEVPLSSPLPKRSNLLGPGLSSP